MEALRALCTLVLTRLVACSWCNIVFSAFFIAFVSESSRVSANSLDVDVVPHVSFPFQNAKFIAILISMHFGHDTGFYVGRFGLYFSAKPHVHDEFHSEFWLDCVLRHQHVSSWHARFLLCFMMQRGDWLCFFAMCSISVCFLVLMWCVVHCEVCLIAWWRDF